MTGVEYETVEVDFEVTEEMVAELNNDIESLSDTEYDNFVKLLPPELVRLE